MEALPQFPKKFLQPAATYTPLKGGRFRWNQGSGPGGKAVIVKRASVRSHRSGQEKSNLAQLQHQIPSAVKKKQLLQAKIDSDGDIRCPHSDCRRIIWGRIYPGKVRCKHCGEEFEAVKYL